MKRITLAGTLLLIAISLFLTADGIRAEGGGQTTVDRITFNFDPTDGQGWSYAYSVIPSMPAYAMVKAIFDGNLLTRPNGNQEVTTLTGTLAFNPGSPWEDRYTIQVKTSALSTYTSGPYPPWCSVVCHTTYTPVEVKYQGSGSNTRDGAGVLSWTSVENLPVAPTTRTSAYLYGLVVSKDQGWQLNMWDRTPTIE